MESKACSIITKDLVSVCGQILARILVQLLTLMLLFQFIPYTALAEEGSLLSPVRTGKKIVVRADPLFPERLPSPGEPFYIKFVLYNAHDLPQNVRVIFNIDGKFTEVYVPGGYLNKADRPEYKVLTYSPVAELSYQIVVQDFDGKYFKSDRYSVRRSCLPNLEITDLDEKWRVKGNELLEISYNRANSLEKELKAYDRAIELLTQLETLMEQ